MEVASNSSSSDDDTSHYSSSSSSNPRERVIRGERKTLSRKDNSSEDEESNSSDSDSGSSTSESGSESDSDSGSADEGNDNDNNDFSSMPLGERIRQQRERGLDMSETRARKSQARKIAAERFSRTKHGDQKGDDDDESPAKQQSKVKKKRQDAAVTTTTTSRKGKSKHAPTEVSSKRRDFYERKVRGVEPIVGAGTSVDIGAHAYKPHDPRVSSLSGHLDEEHFERNFSFLNEMRDQEIELLRKRIAAHKATGKKGQRLRQRVLKADKQSGQGAEGRHFAGTTLEENVQELKRLQQEKATLERNQVDRSAKRAVKQHVKEISGGKTFYLKRNEKKRLHLEAKYEEIRKRGGDQAVDKVLAKRRKKNKSKDAGLLGGGGGGKFSASGGEAKRFRY